jgi:hypothetical protein
MADRKTSRPSFARTLAALWRGLVKDLRDPYRPELHYMRGPGPRWQAKNGDIVAA